MYEYMQIARMDGWNISDTSASQTWAALGLEAGLIARTVRQQPKFPGNEITYSLLQNKYTEKYSSYHRGKFRIPTPQNSACGIVTHRRDTTLICSFLREVWGGRKGEGNVSSVRASTQPDTTVGTVRFCTLYTKVFSRSKSRLCPFYILVWYLL